jgi:hypothetical protein
MKMRHLKKKPEKLKTETRSRWPEAGGWEATGTGKLVQPWDLIGFTQTSAIHAAMMNAELTPPDFRLTLTAACRTTPRLSLLKKS